MRLRAPLVAVFLVAAFAVGEVRAEQAPAAPAAGEAGGREEVAAPAALGRLLGAPAEGFALVTGPRPFEFPADHGPHPEYRSEWWYFTGNVAAADGSR